MAHLRSIHGRYLLSLAVDPEGVNLEVEFSSSCFSLPF